MYGQHFGFVELPFNITPDPRFLYINPRYQEALSILRYGIEARKGFIVITGEAGTGKTTLLRMFMENADANIHTAFCFFPLLNSLDFLRFLLSELGIPGPNADRHQMLTLFKEYLLDNHEKGHVVALLVDEAQALSIDLLEDLRLISNLETDKEKLIQIVFMGQPELEKKLDQPRLRQLKQRVALRYRILPLTHQEVGHYIVARINTAGYQGKELFTAEAIAKIAVYSKGIPRLINVLCDNALLTAYAVNKDQISAEIIEEAHNDLQLTGEAPRELAIPSTAAATKQRTVTPATANREDSRAVNKLGGSAVAASNTAVESAAQAIRTANTSAGLGIRAVMGLMLLVAAGGLVYSEQSKGYLSELAGNIDNLVGTGWENLKRAGRFQTAPTKTTSDEPSRVQDTALESPPLSTPEPNEDRASVAHTSDPAEFEARQAHRGPDGKSIPKNVAQPAREKKTSDEEQTNIQRSGHSSAALDNRESAIHKAIDNRAITGVGVSVRNGVAYLSGRVATEGQKAAAEQAARSVRGVTDVRNEIIVE